MKSNTFKEYIAASDCSCSNLPCYHICACICKLDHSTYNRREHTEGRRMKQELSFFLPLTVI